MFAINQHIISMKKIILSTFIFSALLFSCQTDPAEDAQLLEVNTVVEEEMECETFYAKCYGTAKCFLDFEDLKSNKWGWTNKFNLCETPFSVTYPLWAGAGQCDTEKGTKVGELKIVYDYMEDILTVTYKMYEGFYLSETHLYVGSNPLPTKKNGKVSVAPGDYDYEHMMDKASGDEYSIKIGPGDYYIIAHGVVCSGEEDTEYTPM